MTDTGSALSDLARLAREAGAEPLAREADALAERVREGRFYVACVGQFKRGKSALINALVGQPVLPTGVAPVTSVVTVVRHGAQVAARLQFGDRGWEACDARALVHYVSEEHNPANEKGVAGAEVFVPSALLAHGLCLVDTPGIGSVSAANSAATREFLPRVDAAVVVLGTDPPISGEELALVRELAGAIVDVIVVLNKADRLSPTERAEAVRFTERVLAARVDRDLGSIHQVSALERLAGTGPPRDWPALVARLEDLAQRAGADLVHAAGQRGLAALRIRLLRDLDQQLAALTRPVEETRVRVALIEQTVRAAEGALGELAHRLAAVQDRLAGTFTDARNRFFAGALTEAQAELRAIIRSAPAETGLRGRAIDAAAEITRRCIEQWRREQEPGAEALFREGFGRFIALVDEFKQPLRAVPELAEVTDDLVALGFTGRSGFHYTEMLTVVPTSAGSRVLDLLRTRAGRVRAVERDASAYLARLLEVNSARLKNDFLRRLGDSRAQLERALRARLKSLSASAQHALEQARTAHTEGAEAMSSRVQALERLRSEVDRLLPQAVPAAAVSCVATRGRITAPATGDDGGAPLDAGLDRPVV